MKPCCIKMAFFLFHLFLMVGFEVDAKGKIFFKAHPILLNGFPLSPLKI
jgi:hypothetical protein